MIDLYPSALPRPPEGTAPTELGPLADALWTGLAGITQALFPCSPWLLANPPANNRIFPPFAGQSLHLTEQPVYPGRARLVAGYGCP